MAPKGTNARSEADKTPPKKAPRKKKKAAPKTTGEAKTAEKEEANKKNQEEAEAQASVEDERKRQEKEAKEVEKRKKEQASKDYKELLAEVEELKELTDTTAWKKFYAKLERRIAKAGRDILDAEKPRDIIRCQETVKIIRMIIAEVKTPVNDLQTFCNSMSLFAAGFSTRAAWNDGVGSVELSGQKPKKK